MNSTPLAWPDTSGTPQRQQSCMRVALRIDQQGRVSRSQGAARITVTGNAPLPQSVVVVVRQGVEAWLYTRTNSPDTPVTEHAPGTSRV